MFIGISLVWYLAPLNDFCNKDSFFENVNTDDVFTVASMMQWQVKDPFWGIHCQKLVYSSQSTLALYRKLVFKNTHSLRVYDCDIQLTPKW